MTISNFTPTLKRLGLFILISIIFGVFKSEFIISYVPFELRPITRLSSYLSVVTGSMFSYITLLLLLTASFSMLYLTSLKTCITTFQNAIKWFIYCLIINEVFKILSAYLLS